MQTTLTPRTLVDLLLQRAESHRDKVAFRFCPDGDEEQSRLTYHELDIKAREIGAALQQQGAAGQRVLVLCRPDLDSVAGIFGCLYAGAVAVPVDDHWVSARVASIVPDVQAGFALATAKSQEKWKTTVDGLVDGRALQWCAMDEGVGDAENWVMPDIDASTTASVQYTSGTTRSPRGVVLTHHNFLHNLQVICQVQNPAFEAVVGDPAFGNAVTGVSWLPHFHDMGLVAGVLATLYVGGSTVLMSPTAFLMRPMRWLKAMSHHRAVSTAAPDFAYDLCVKRSTAEERAELDLSNWSIAVNGGAPVQADTLRAFADAFAPAGFRPEAFFPVYGLAEATLLVSGGSDFRAPVVHHIDRTALGEDRVVDAAPDRPTAAKLVACGPPQGGQDVVIVDPETRRPCRADEVGEIWVAGPNVGQGYWGHPEETEQNFSAFLSETGDGPFLRTGDRGFLRGGELFITGRSNDLIIIRDFKYYPNDIEMTVQDCDPDLLPSRGAVFAVTPKPNAAEQLVVVQEVHRHRARELELTDIIDAIRAAVPEHHGIAPHSVVLVKPMKIPTTSSGKIQRSQCRQLFLDGELKAVAEWHAPPPPDDGIKDPKTQVALGVGRFLALALARRHRASRHTSTSPANPSAPDEN